MNNASLAGVVWAIALMILFFWLSPQVKNAFGHLNDLQTGRIMAVTSSQDSQPSTMWGP